MNSLSCVSLFKSRSSNSTQGDEHPGAAPPDAGKPSGPWDASVVVGTFFVKNPELELNRDSEAEGESEVEAGSGSGSDSDSDLGPDFSSDFSCDAETAERPQSDPEPESDKQTADSSAAVIDQRASNVCPSIPASRIITSLPVKIVGAALALGIVAFGVYQVARAAIASNAAPDAPMPTEADVLAFVRAWVDRCQLCDPGACQNLVNEIVGYLKVLTTDIANYGNAGIYDHCYAGDVPRSDDSYPEVLAEFLRQERTHDLRQSSAVQAGAQRLPLLLIASVIAALQARFM